MKRVVSTAVDPGPYRADVCLVWCTDNRFSKLLIWFSGQKVDLIKVHGGGAGIMGTEEERQFIFDQIRTSLEKSDPSVVALMIHVGCSVYGERKTTKHEAGYQDEFNFFTDQIESIKQVVREFIDEEGFEAEVAVYIADFDGLLML